MSLSKYGEIIQGLFNIYNKDGDLVPFIPNSIQQLLDQEYQEHNFLSVLKYRQGGISTYIMALFLVECMTSHQTAVMLAHDKDHTEKLLQRAQNMLKNLKGGVKPKTSKFNENEIVFSQTDSTFFIGTAGSKDFGRSATISRLHCSEIAFWKEPKRLLTGLLQSVPARGKIIQETTGNGWGTWFQQNYYKYMAGLGKFKALFYPWYIHSEYISLTPLDLPYTDQEIALKEKYNLTDPQLQWRREKILEFEQDETLFSQEYPTTVQDAFRLSGGSLFQKVEISESEEWISLSQDESILRSHPRKGYTYVLGNDTSGGTGNDYSVIEVFCLETLEQVYEWSSKYIEPPDVASKIAEVGKRYNTAYLVPEFNSHGISVVSILRKIYPLHRIFKRNVTQRKATNQTIATPGYGYGWTTTGITKPYMVGLAQKFISTGIKVYSPVLFSNLKSFSETPEGKLEGIGEHDDHAIAFFLVCIGLLKMSQFLGVELKLDPEQITEVNVTEKIKEIKLASDRRNSQRGHRDSEGNLILDFNSLFDKKDWRKIHAVA